MSGGSYDYMYARICDTYEGRMFDSQLNEMIVDLEKVLHDLEWWQSCDISEDTYRKTVTEFKRKWFGQSETDVKTSIEMECDKLKNELLKEFEYLNEADK